MLVDWTDLLVFCVFMVCSWLWYKSIIWTGYYDSAKNKVVSGTKWRLPDKYFGNFEKHEAMHAKQAKQGLFGILSVFSECALVTLFAYGIFTFNGVVALVSGAPVAFACALELQSFIAGFNKMP